MSQHQAFKRIAMICCSLTLSLTGCVSPTPMTFTQRQQRVMKDWNKIFNHQDSIPQRITMAMAMARALKYNLDIDIKNTEVLVSEKRFKLADYDMWPQLLASAGYLARSNFNAASSFNLITNEPNFGASTSEDKTRRVAGLEFSWNLLDFGIGYLTAKQGSDHFLINLQRRRRTIQNIMRDVRYAYWRAYSAQQVEHKLGPLMQEVHWAIHNSRKASTEKLHPVLSSLNYRHSLYDVLRHLTELQRQLVEAKSELSALMSMPPGTQYILVKLPQHNHPLPKNFPKNLALLEKIALYDRPELQEEDYAKRISVREIDKARLNMFPGLTFNVGRNYDSNGFLLNKSWANLGIDLVWNVIKLFSGPAAIRVAKGNSLLADFRRMALTVVVLTQVDVAEYRYHQAFHELAVDKQLYAIDTKIYKQMIKLYKEKRINRLKLTKAKANRILSQLRYNLAYAEWQNAAGQLLASIGYDLTAGINPKAPLAQIALQIKQHLHQPINISPMLQKIIKIRPPHLTNTLAHNTPLLKPALIFKIAKLPGPVKLSHLTRLPHPKNISKRYHHRS